MKFDFCYQNKSIGVNLNLKLELNTKKLQNIFLPLLDAYLLLYQELC